MAITVFFSNKNIQIIVGKRKGRSVYVDRIIETPMPNDSIFNGVVVEGGEDAISFRLKEVWNSNHLKGEAELIINSPKLISSRKEMPIISKISKATEYLDKQISSEEYGRFESPLKGWYLLDTNNSEKYQTVVTEIAEQKSIDSFINIFNKAGITLASVHEGVSLATILFSHCVKDTTSIYMILDDNMLVTILYVKGKYYYDSTRRIFQQPGTEEFATEINNNIDGILKFARSQKIQETITDVYFAGISAEDIGKLQSSLAGTDLDIATHGVVAPSHIHFKKWNDKLSSFVYPIAGLYIPDTGFPLLKAIRKNDEEYTKKRELLVSLIPIGVLTLILTIISLFLLIVYLSSSSRLEELNSYNRNPEVIQMSAEYDTLVSQASQTGTSQSGVDTLKQYIDSYPLPNSSINNQILEAANAESVNIDFGSYDSASGIFSTTASSPFVENINKFIAKLLEMDIFENVDYTGYEWNDETAEWSIKVICTLSENAAKEAK